MIRVWRIGSTCYWFQERRCCWGYVVSWTRKVCGLLTTLLVCLNCPLEIYGRDFRIDLVCFPLSQLDVIMGMNWLELNHVCINCLYKSVKFLKSEESTKSSFMSAKLVGMSLRELSSVHSVHILERGKWNNDYKSTCCVWVSQSVPIWH